MEVTTVLAEASEGFDPQLLADLLYQLNARVEHIYALILLVVCVASTYAILQIYYYILSRF